MPLVEHQQAFEDDLPFEEFTVRVAEADLPQLPVILKGLMDHPDRPVAAKQVRATPISNPGTSPQHANRDRHVNQKAVRS